MDGEVGAQLATPIFMSLPGQFREVPATLLAKKRDFPWTNQQQLLQMSDAFPNTSGNWNPNRWEWDSLGFMAKPSSSAAPLLGRAAQTPPAVTWEQQQKKASESSRSPISTGGEERDGDNLTLKLGGVSYLPEEPAAAARPNKRVRSGSPGNGSGSAGSGSFPMCQVDDCRADLSGAKDYHRRHKVCEVHSKTTKALVAKQLQRFCQQCSRFHPLSEFDEGKRSCRRRLAGHNRRRRKTQPEEPQSRFLLPGNQDTPASGNSDIVNLITMLACLQGSNQGKPASTPPLPDRDRILQLLKKLNTSNNGILPSRSSPPGEFDLNVSQAPPGPLDQSLRMNDKEASTSSTNLLAVFSAALSASAPEALASLSQGSSESSGIDKPVPQKLPPAIDNNLHKRTAQIFPPSVGRNKISASPMETSQQQVQGPRQSLPIQLFSSSEDDSPPKVGSVVKYVSSESSNPMEDRSPSSSPPITQRLFPLHSASDNTKHARESNGTEDNMAVELSTNLVWDAPLDLFGRSSSRDERGTVQSVPYQAGYTSSSGSDHSPSSSISDAQDRTGRIIFKLFGKDPSSFPAALRIQILNWLSNSPSEMESYIRPGCVVLSIYISMHSVAWEELEDDLLQRVTSLVQYSDCREFWKNGRFFVRTNRQLVSHKDGKFRLSKSWRAWGAPEVTFVSPLAVVSGQETTLVLKGRNLTVPGTKIYCTYMGKYMCKEVLCSTHPGTIYDDSSTERFDFPCEFPWIFGRCFIEVENSFKGNSFPVIIADASICQELRTLESDFKEDARSASVSSPEDQVLDNARPLSREDLLHFLNELGWLFQKMHAQHNARFHDFSTTRFRLLLIFSVERGWCALMKAILDIMVQRGLGNDILEQESLEMLSEILVLNRAVKRKCRAMVDLLLHYSLNYGDHATRAYLFLPNMAGPGGVTPLHLAASSQDSEDMVDALTSDPQGVGLGCWTSLQDENGETPFTYASMRGHHSYNKLVSRKIADRRNGQITLAVVDEENSVIGEPSRPAVHASQAISCAQCAFMASGRLRRTTRTPGMLHRSYILSMLAIAAVCVCVCIFYRASPDTGTAVHFKWEDLDFGVI